MDDEALSAALEVGDLEAVKHFVDNGAPLYPEELLRVVSSGNLDLIKYFVEKLNINFNFDDDTDDNNFLIKHSLILAVQNKNLNIIKYFIERGVDDQILNYLLKNIDASIKATPPYNKPKLNKYYSMLFYLLDKDANFSLLSKNTKNELRRIEENDVQRKLTMRSKTGTGHRLPGDIVNIIEGYLTPHNLFGKKHSKRILKKRSKKRSKRTLKKLYKKHSKMSGECRSKSKLCMEKTNRLCK